MHSDTNQFKCDECEYTTSLKISLTRHRREKHDIVQIKCDLCTFSGNRFAVGDHIRNRHSDVKKCKYCDYRTRHNSMMLNHQRVKHEGIYFDCDECGSKLTSKQGLKWHRDNKHRGVRFKCPKCDYMATLKANLKIHDQAMHESIKYPCDKCSYTASTPRSLTWHSQKCKGPKTCKEWNLWVRIYIYIYIYIYAGGRS